MEIIIDRENVALVDAYSKMGFVEEIITREDFETNFHIDLSGITNVTYSPLKKQYFVTYGEIDVRVFDEPSNNTILNHININVEAIKSYIENVWIENHKPTKYHTMSESGEFVISAENQALLDADNQILEAKAYLAETDWVVVKINEASIQGQDTTAMVDKYADILIERENKRLTINQLQG